MGNILENRQYKSLKQKWAISLQITALCAYNYYKVWHSLSFNLQSAKELVLCFFCDIIFYYIRFESCRGTILENRE